MELRQLKPAVAVRGPHHRDVDSDAVEPDDTVHPTSLDRRLALQLHTKFDKERNSSLKVVDDDAHVVHPLNRHGGSPSSSRGLSWPLVYLGRSQRHILDTRKRAEFTNQSASSLESKWVRDGRQPRHWVEVHGQHYGP